MGPVVAHQQAEVIQQCVPGGGCHEVHRPRVILQHLNDTIEGFAVQRPQANVDTASSSLHLRAPHRTRRVRFRTPGGAVTGQIKVRCHLLTQAS